MTPHTDTHTPSSAKASMMWSRSYRPRAFARSFCKQPSDADDLVQETLTKAIAKIHCSRKARS